MTRLPEKLDDAHSIISDAANLTDALQIVLWDISNAPDHKALSQQQLNALIGLGDALERALTEAEA